MNQTTALSINTYFSDSGEHVIEDILLRHSARGMNILQQYLAPDYCRRVASHILNLRRGNILLTTGFYVAGHAETDGPPGTVSLAHALKNLGFTPTIITDDICRELFESEGFAVEYVDTSAGKSTYQELLDKYDPVCLISIERCGRNLENKYANMRGVSITEQTACIDIMFDLARSRHILTVGIGDGGNEIGMGNLKDIISKKLELSPCTVPVDELIIATVSNWGAYGLAAYLSILTNTFILPAYQVMASYLNRIVALGCVDGVVKRPQQTVDGFSSTVEEEILGALHSYVTDILRSQEGM